jgi:hypothetical protein
VRADGSQGAQLVDSARSVYELWIVDPSPSKQATAIAKTLVVNALLASSAYWQALPARVTVRIVDRRNDRVVFERSTSPDVANLFAVDIATGLDRLNQVDFEREWGIGVEQSDAPKGRYKFSRIPGIVLRGLFGRGS